LEGDIAELESDKRVVRDGGSGLEIVAVLIRRKVDPGRLDGSAIEPAEAEHGESLLESDGVGP
jgi:hypothetical protein